MPYVDSYSRQRLDENIDCLGALLAVEGTGEANYVITKLLQYWMGKNPNYATLDAAVGVLECVKLELYRRKIGPYEDKKCKENGDVY
jgi:hypothetical protein